MKNNKEILSEKEIKDYLNKNTSPEIKHSIEKKISLDPFYSDAMEGFENFPEEIQNINAIKNDVRKKIFNNNFNYMYLAAAVVICFVSTFAFFYFNNKSDVILAENLKTEAPALGQKETIETNVEQKETEVKEEIIVEQKVKQILEAPLSKQKEIIPAAKDETVIMDAESAEELEEIKEAESKSNNTANRSSANISSMNKITPSTPITSAVNANKKTKRNTSYNYPTDFIKDLKVADYSKEGMRKSDFPHLASSHAEARYKSKAASEEAVVVKKRISYIDFLNETMGQFYSSDYKSAILGFKMIEKHFPEDVNAMFYSGLCYYNLGMPEKAIPYFEKTENHYINIFNEEAEWYRALSYEFKNDKENAENLFKKIINKEGFYAEKAIKKLKKLKN